MSTLTGSAAEPQSTLTVPTVGADTDLWGDILNDTTLQALLNYILWLKARVPATDPSGEADGRTLVVSSGALVFGDAASGGGSAEEVAYDNGTSGLAAEDVQAAIDELASEKANISDLGTAAAADAGDFATAAQGALADTALQPGDELTALAATGITAGYVPKADGANGIVWAEEAGGGGGGGGIDPSDGLVVVQHGAVAATARPTAGVVYWMGSVAPDNRVTGDLWLETGAFD